MFGGDHMLRRRRAHTQATRAHRVTLVDGLRHADAQTARGRSGASGGNDGAASERARGERACARDPSRDREGGPRGERRQHEDQRGLHMRTLVASGETVLSAGAALSLVPSASAWQR